MNMRMKRPGTTVSMPAKFHHQTHFIDFLQEPIYEKHCLKRSGNEIRILNDKLNTKDPGTFSNRYKEVCNALHIQPLNMVKVLLTNISLDITCDRLKMMDLLAILKTIQEDRSLHYISLKSKLRGFALQEEADSEKKAKEADKVLYTRFMVNRMADCLRECVTYSDNLKALKLQGIPFGGNSIEILSQGLKRTETVQHLSLEGCRLGDEGCLRLCRALRDVPTLLTLDLSAARLSSLGAQHIAALIKGQEIARLEQNWKQSLRFRTVNNHEMKGLRRITLNDNPEIGDDGFKLIIDVLMDDYWIRALDVQNCGITDYGANLAMEMIKANNEIGVVDLRRNPQIDNRLVAGVVKAASAHMTPEKAEFGWLCMPKVKKINSAHTDCNSTVNYPWNSGPGIRKAKSICETDPATKASIIKVKEWSKSRGNTSVSVFPVTITSEVPKKQIVVEAKLQSPEVPKNKEDNSTDSSNNSQSTLTSDESKQELNTNKETSVAKQTDDIEKLFCKFISSAAADEKSDSDN